MAQDFRVAHGTQTTHRAVLVSVPYNDPAIGNRNEVLLIQLKISSLCVNEVLLIQLKISSLCVIDGISSYRALYYIIMMS